MSRAVYEDDVIKLLNKGWKSGVYPLACDVRALPPAQPKPEKCINCKHCEIDPDTGYAYCDAWKRGTQVDWYCSRGK